MSEVLVIVQVVLLFIGGKKISELMKGLSKGVRSFKEGMNSVEKNQGTQTEGVTDVDRYRLRNSQWVYEL